MEMNEEILKRQRRVLIFNSARGRHMGQITKALDGLGLLFAPLSWAHDDGTETLTELESTELQLVVSWKPDEPIKNDGTSIPQQVAIALRQLALRALDAAERVERVPMPEGDPKPLAYLVKDRESKELISSHFFHWPAMDAARGYSEQTGRTTEVITEPLSEHPETEKQLIDAMQFEDVPA